MATDNPFVKLSAVDFKDHLEVKKSGNTELKYVPHQTKAQRSGFCLELRSKGAERGMPFPAGRYTRSGLCDEVVGTGCCPI